MKGTTALRVSWAVATLVATMALADAANAAPAAPPSIDGASATNITATDATLGAQIDPNGLDTSYRFRLESGCLPPLACLAIHEYPLPSSDLPASFEAQEVSLDLSEAGVHLRPDTKYRYSVEATNSAGTTESPGQTFTTPSAGVAPVIESESASRITRTDATLEAQVNTEGLEAGYEFQLLSAPLCLEASPPCERPQYVLALPSGNLLDPSSARASAST